MQRSLLALSAMCIVLATGCSPKMSETETKPHITATSDIAAGRYLVVLSGCNDCHTPGWAKSNGTMQEADWLTGSPVGRKGPWGTTYAQNLRLIPGMMSEDDFVGMLRTRHDKPPMPWMNLNRADETDLRAIYRFLKSLGPKGNAMPLGLPPGEEPTTPYIDMTLRNP